MISLKPFGDLIKFIGFRNQKLKIEGRNWLELGGLIKLFLKTSKYFIREDYYGKIFKFRYYPR